MNIFRFVNNALTLYFSWLNKKTMDCSFIIRPIVISVQLQHNHGFNVQDSGRNW